MLKRIIVLILAACTMLCTVSLAKQETDVTEAAGEIAYEDETLTVRLGEIILEEDSVTVPITFENTGTRYCTVTAEVSREVMEGEGLDALRAMLQINGGEVGRNIGPGGTVSYNVCWKTDEAYTESLFTILLPKLQPEEVLLAAKDFPGDTIGCLSVVICDENLETETLEDLFSALAGLDETNARLLELRIVSAE